MPDNFLGLEMMLTSHIITKVQKLDAVSAEDILNMHISAY